MIEHIPPVAMHLPLTCFEICLLNLAVLSTHSLTVYCFFSFWTKCISYTMYFISYFHTHWMYTEIFLIWVQYSTQTSFCCYWLPWWIVISGLHSCFFVLFFLMVAGWNNSSQRFPTEGKSTQSWEIEFVELPFWNGPQLILSQRGTIEINK